MTIRKRKKEKTESKGLCDTTNPTNVLTVEIPEKEKSTQSIFEKVAENFPI